MAGSSYYNPEILLMFDAVVNILPENEDDENYNDKIERVRGMKIGMSSIYKYQLEHQTNRPDFSDRTRRWTYMYAYLARHVHLVYGALQKLEPDSDIFNNLKGQPIVCSIGGGPNIDALGLSLFINSCSDVDLPFTKIHVFDQCVQWDDSWNELRENLPGQYQHDVEYHEFDYKSSDISEDCEEVIGQADIITMIKSLSSVAAWKDEVQPTVRKIMKGMKQGALLLYIDNSGAKNAKDLLTEVLVENGQTHSIIHNDDLTDVKLTSDIYSDTAQELIAEIINKPVLQAGNNNMILIKRNC